jgi:uncharacterized membrane protein
MPAQPGEQTRQPGHVRQLSQVSLYSGPLPKPEDLIKYNEAFPGCAERIVGMAEQQSRYRQDLERRVVDHNIQQDRRGQTLGFALSVIGIVGSLSLIGFGRPTEGLTVFFTSLTTLVGIFVYSRVEQRRELDRKAQAFQLPTKR